MDKNKVYIVNKFIDVCGKISFKTCKVSNSYAVAKHCFEMNVNRAKFKHRLFSDDWVKDDYFYYDSGELTKIIIELKEYYLE